MLIQYNSQPQRGEVLVATGFSPWFKNAFKLCRPRVFHEKKNSDATQGAGTLIETPTIQCQRLTMQENKMLLALINDRIGAPDLKVGATKNVYFEIPCQSSNQI